MMPSTTRSSSRFYLLSVIFFIGFAALIYEIYSVQVLFMFFVNNTHAVSIAISSFLAGLAVSSIAFSWYVGDRAHNLRIIFWMQLAAAIYGAFILHRVDLVPALLDIIYSHVETPATIELLKVGLMWMFLFVPAFFIGGALPLINGLYMQQHETGTRDTGVVYFWDMLGAILGALLAGFLFLPKLGIYWTSLIPVAINLLICFACVTSRRTLAWAILFTFVIIGALTYQKISRDSDQPANPLDKNFGKIVFQKESPFGRITVGDTQFSRRLFINYRAMCDENSGRYSEGQLGKILSALVKPAERGLNIGLGCGTTAASMAMFGAFKQLDIVEINPVVKEAAERYFDKANHDVVRAPHVNTMIANGAEYVRTNDQIYDAIAIDIEEVNIIYSSPLYTKEYFDIIKTRLTPNGVLGVWSFEVNDDFSKVMYNTLKASFEHVVLFPTLSANLYFASSKPIDKFPLVTEPKYLERQRIILGNPNKGINTLNYKLLEKYYNVGRIFGLPSDYTEPFFTPNKP